jgi:hypothetical protein
MRLFHFRTLFFKLSSREEKLQAAALTTGPLERARRETRAVVDNMVNLECVVYYNEISIGETRGRKGYMFETIMLASPLFVISVFQSTAVAEDLVGLPV